MQMALRTPITTSLCFLLFASCLEADVSSLRQASIVSWLNEQLEKANYRSRLTSPLCETRIDPIGEVTACSYKYRDGSYISIAETKESLISFNVLAPVVGDEFEEIERDSMYIFSLFIWGTMSETASYDDANELLLEMYNSSFETPVAEKSEGHWSFAIAEIHTCPYGILVLASQDTRTGLTGSDAVTSLTTYGCKFLPNFP